jgi:hypothetical protein
VFYDEAGQQMCLDVRRRNCGINGRAILFYARRSDVGTHRRPSKRVKRKEAKLDSIFVGHLKGLGLSSATDRQVEATVSELYPTGLDGKSESEVLRNIFLHLKSKENHD